MAKLSTASCRAVGRAGLSGKVADRPSDLQGPQTHLILGTPAKDRHPVPDCGDIFRNNSLVGEGRGPFIFICAEIALVR